MPHPRVIPSPAILLSPSSPLLLLTFLKKVLAGVSGLPRGNILYHSLHIDYRGNSDLTTVSPYFEDYGSHYYLDARRIPLVDALTAPMVAGTYDADGTLQAL